MSDIDIMHELIIARDAAKQHAGTELGELWRERCNDLENALSPDTKMQMLLSDDDECVAPVIES